MRIISISEFAALTFGMLLLSLYSIVGEGNTPILPIIGYVILFASLIARFSWSNNSSVDYWVFSVLSLLVIVSTFYASFLTNNLSIKGSIGILMGLFLYLAASSYRSYQKLTKSLVIVLVVHVAAFYYQLISFYFRGEYLDYLSIFNAEYAARSEYHADNFTLQRFSGFFAEPAIYGYFIFMITAILVRSREFSGKEYWLCVISIASMFASLSISSVFLGAILTGIILLNHKRRTLLLLLFFILAITSAILPSDSIVFEYIISRLFSPLDDPSGYARYGSFGSVLQTNGTEIMFGVGAGNYDNFSTTNNYLNIMQIFGIIGLGIFLVCFMVASRFDAYTMFVVAISLLNGYVLTTLFWWVFLGLITRGIYHRC